MSNPKQRKTIITLHMRKAHTSWVNSTIEFRQNDFEHGDRVAVVKIEGPYDLAYIREQLDSIEKYWRQQLGSLNS